MTKPLFDREKYLDVLRSQGVAAALTLLHRDMADIEYDAFEGPRKINAERLAQLNAMRDFSRELWDVSVHVPSATK